MLYLWTFFRGICELIGEVHCVAVPQQEVSSVKIQMMMFGFKFLLTEDITDVFVSILFAVTALFISLDPCVCDKLLVF